MALVTTGVFRRKYQLVTVLARGDPFTQPHLGLFVLIAVGGIDEIPCSIGESFQQGFVVQADVTSLANEMVEYFKSLRLSTFAHPCCVGIAEAH